MVANAHDYPPIDWTIQVVATTPSTQDLAHEAAREGAGEGLVIQAMKQDNARGRHGKTWDAPMGNIYMSLILRPRCDMSLVGDLGFVVAVALSDALDCYMDKAKHKKTLKWPNDILVNGLKMSGILLETNMQGEALDSVIVGIGLNVFNAPDFATCLNEVAKEPVYINKVRNTILDELSKTYALWREEGIVPIRLRWLKNAHGLGQAITARLPNETHKGIFEGLSEEGGLILKQDNDERIIINAGEVHFGEAS